MGWTKIAHGPLEIETVPGSHDTLFKAPFVGTLARRLDAAIGRTSTVAAVNHVATPEPREVVRFA
jgi:hypothetical protein